MPFTFAHPAAILYFRHKFKKTSTTGLVMGSLGPDLGYYARFRICGRLEHSWIVSVFIVLPLVFFFSLLYHCLVKQKMIEHLPLYLKSRMIRWTDFDFIKYMKKNSLTFIVCAIVGIYSHLVWDSFTHFDGFFVEQFDTLKLYILELPFFKWMQYGGSVIGILILALYFHSLPVEENTNHTYSIKYIIFVFALSLFIVSIRFYFFPIPMKIGNWLVVPISAFFLSLSVAGLLCKLRRNR